jgi:hypothetical protein
VRRRYGIPLTFLLLALSLYAGGFLPFQPVYLLIWGTAIWAAFDSKKLDVTQYDSSLAIPPLGVLIALVLFWPVTFPWYLKLRWRIKNGEIGQKGGISVVAMAVFSVFLLIVAGGVVLVWQAPTLMNLATISLAASAEYRETVKVSLSGSNLTLSMNDSKLPKDSASRARVARELALFALERFKDTTKLRSIAVELNDETQAGGVTVTRGSDKFRWSMAQLRDRSTLAAAASANTAATVTPAGAPTKVGTRPAAPAPATSSMSGSRRTASNTASRAVSPTAFARLAAADPATRWERPSALVADVDCDNVPDTVVVGRRSRELHVGLARAVDQEPQILVFDVGAGKGSVASARVQVELESLDFDPADKGLQALAGLQRSGTCKGLMFGDAGKRKVHIFWSRQTRHVEWFQR